MDQLPRDVLIYLISTYCEYPEIRALTFVCRDLRNIMSMPIIWTSLFQRDFPRFAISTSRKEYVRQYRHRLTCLRYAEEIKRITKKTEGNLFDPKIYQAYILGRTKIETIFQKISSHDFITFLKLYGVDPQTVFGLRFNRYLI